MVNIQRTLDVVVLLRTLKENAVRLINNKVQINAD